jgi:dihydroorotase
MQRVGMPLLIHGEVTRPQIDVFDRERVFIDEVLIPMRRDLPELKIVFEHVTTRKRSATFSKSAAPSARRSPRTTCCLVAIRFFRDATGNPD